MLLCLTPNPALDRTLVIPALRFGGVYRAERVLVAPGGKGLNVARAARTLGQPLRVCAPLAGLTGQLVAHLATAEGIDARWSWCAGGETRVCVLVVDPQASDATALNEPGWALTPDDWQAFVAAALAAAAEAQLVTLSGSLPPGVPPAGLADLVRQLGAAGHRVIVDSSGAALQAALDSQPYGLKVNSSELSAALALPISNPQEAVPALAALRERGIALAAVSLGAQGAVAASDEGIGWACPPTIEIISSIGSGDSLLAGLSSGLLRGQSLQHALCLGVTCGAADALTIGGGLIDLADVERLLSATTFQWLA